MILPLTWIDERCGMDYIPKFGESTPQIEIPRKTDAQSDNNKLKSPNSPENCLDLSSLTAIRVRGKQSVDSKSGNKAVVDYSRKEIDEDNTEEILDSTLQGTFYRFEKAATWGGKFLLGRLPVPHCCPPWTRMEKGTQ